MIIRENLERVRERIARAARGAGRDPSEVTLVGVGKGIPPERIRQALACGIREIGENRVQEAAEKQLALGTAPAGPARRRFSGGDCSRITWHLIGHLQRNKAKLAVQIFDVIHSVDSLELIEALEQQMTQRRPGRMLETLLQVNVSGEATQNGCRPDEAATLAEALLRAKHLKFAGLMTMAPYSENPEDARPVFRKLRELRGHLQRDVPGGPLGLSMGMSGDFEVAVQEGATMVRIGTAIFGERTVASR